MPGLRFAHLRGRQTEIAVRLQDGIRTTRRVEKLDRARRSGIKAVLGRSETRRIIVREEHAERDERIPERRFAGARAKADRRAAINLRRLGVARGDSGVVIALVPDHGRPNARRGIGYRGVERRTGDTRWRIGDRAGEELLRRDKTRGCPEFALPDRCEARGDRGLKVGGRRRRGRAEREDRIVGSACGIDREAEVGCLAIRQPHRHRKTLARKRLAGESEVNRERRAGRTGDRDVRHAAAQRARDELDAERIAHRVFRQRDGGADEIGRHAAEACDAEVRLAALVNDLPETGVGAVAEHHRVGIDHRLHVARAA